MLSLWLLSSKAMDLNETRRVQRALIITMLLACLIASRTVLSTAVAGIRYADKMKKESSAIATLAECHKSEAGTTYIFMLGSYRGPMVNPFKYGALTQLKTAIQPTNFRSMTSQLKNKYFDKMRPCKIIPDSSVDINQVCESTNES